MEIELGNYKVQSAEEAPTRLAMLLWGVAGCGKTSLAATAPGKKLWILFDDGGLASVQGLRADAPEASALSNEILVLDLSHEKNNIIDKFKRDDGLGIGKLLEDEELGIETVVVDSVTRLSQMGLEHSVQSGIHSGALLERVSPGAYGGRNALMLRAIVDLMNVTAKYNKNIIFIAHEGQPSTDKDGNVLSISMSLGGQLPTLTTQKLGEVWFMQDDGKGNRKINLRPFRAFKPMKTRMFNIPPAEPAEFIWKYDVLNPDPKMEIATWYKEWKDNGGRKLSIPK